MSAVVGFNQSVVIDTIRRSPEGMSRVELVEITGLSPQTISNVTRRLIDRGFIREAGRKIAGPGKPRTMLELDPSGGFALGVHMDPSVITLVILDVAGTVITHSQIRSPESGDSAETINAIGDSVRNLIIESGVEKSRLVGVGIAAPGPIDAERGVIVRPPLMPSWNDFPVRDAVSAVTGLPALMTKDATAAAIAERWTNPSESTANFLFVYYGTGVGLGLVLADSIFEGASSNAGDIGHVLVAVDGPMCSCGRRGCYGELVRPKGIVEQAMQAGVLGGNVEGMSFTEIDASLDVVLSAAAAGDSRALHVLHETVEASAVFIANLANLLDIDHVVFGGPYWSKVQPYYEGEIIPRMRRLRMDVLTHPVSIITSAVGEDVAAVGAACLVLDSKFAPRSSRLLIAPDAISSVADAPNAL